jgi:hypothetical protein
VDLTGTEDTAGGVSTVSLNWDDIAGTEANGRMVQRRILSTVSLNRDKGMDLEVTRLFAPSR